MERLFDLAKMTYVDAIEDEIEVRVLTKIAIGLGYSSQPQKIVRKALGIVADQNIDFEKFKEKMND